MKKIQKFFEFAFLALTMIIATSGCAKPQPASLTDEQVGTAVENILTAINNNDYQKFTQDFSDQMISAFPEVQFKQTRDLLQQASGNYVSMGIPTLLNQNGYTLYRIPCKYEKEDVIVTITFAIGGDKVEGLFFDSTNLRSASK
jgi:hypothetical protein